MGALESVDLHLHQVEPVVELLQNLPRIYQSKNKYFTELSSGSEAGSCLRLIDFVYHSTLGLRVNEEEGSGGRAAAESAPDIS